MYFKEDKDKISEVEEEQAKKEPVCVRCYISSCDVKWWRAVKERRLFAVMWWTCCDVASGEM